MKTSLHILTLNGKIIAIDTDNIADNIKTCARYLSDKDSVSVTDRITIGHYYAGDYPVIGEPIAEYSLQFGLFLYYPELPTEDEIIEEEYT